jgi:uroporphyrinogen-III synthase
MADAGAPLRGLTIGITAERKAQEQAELFHRRGAATLHGATLRIVSEAGDGGALVEVTAEVIRHPPDYVLASTGYGMRTWFAAAERQGVGPALLEALGRAKVANRGVKSASANTGVGLAEWWRAPDERFDQVVERVLEERLDGCRVVIQLHGCALPEAVARLEAAGACVLQVDAYSARLPEDPGPAEALIDATIQRRLAAVTFTAAPAVHNLFTLAGRIGRADDLRRAFNEGVVAGCVGPVCAEGATEEGIELSVVPGRARLVPLVVAVTEHLASRR